MTDIDPLAPIEALLNDLRLGESRYPTIRNLDRRFRDALTEAREALDALVAERLDFTSRLGFGDDQTERAATLAQMVEPIEQAFSEARDHAECPVVCELCGESLADTICERCHGSGCLPNAALAYLECDECAGAGRVHVGCTELSYADLVAERDQLREALARVEALAKLQAVTARARAESDRHWLDVLAIIERAALTQPAADEEAGQ